MSDTKIRFTWSCVSCNHSGVLALDPRDTVDVVSARLEAEHAKATRDAPCRAPRIYVGRQDDSA